MTDALGFLVNKFANKRLSRLLLPLMSALLLQLSACGGNDMASDQDLCAPFDGLTPICGFQSPEDLALLPDGKGILVSEYGHMGENEGKLSILHLADHSRTELYSSQSSNDLRGNNAIWGDTSCTEPEYFSPHGIDLSQRPGGRWQLLVVNHGGREAIEMFELLKNDSAEWQLIWRGCVEARDDSSFNDVAALDNGFVTTRMMSRDGGMLGMLDYFLGRDTGFLWQWDLQSGLTPVANTEGVMPNGVVADKNINRVFINIYGEDKLRILDLASKEIVHEIDIRSADNTNWDTLNPGKLLVATHDFNFLDMAGCLSDGSGNCPAEFDIVEIDANDFSKKLLFRADGKFYGAGTAALRVGETLYIGSFTGERILLAPVGYGVE